MCTLSLSISLPLSLYIYMKRERERKYTHTHTHIYIYIYIERERENENMCKYTQFFYNLAEILKDSVFFLLHYILTHTQTYIYIYLFLHFLNFLLLYYFREECAHFVNQCILLVLKILEPSTHVITTIFVALQQTC